MRYSEVENPVEDMIFRVPTAFHIILYIRIECDCSFKKRMEIIYAVK